MKGPSVRCLLPLLAAAVAMALGACRLLPKKAPAAVAEASKPAEIQDGPPKPTPPGEPAPTPDPPKSGEPAEAAGAAEAKPDPGPSLADPLEAPEFKTLPKGEAEFILACRSAGAGEKATVAGREGLLFSTAELRVLGAAPAPGSPHHQATATGIAAYSASLKAAGIELVVAPVPPKAIVYPDYVGAEELKDRRYDSQLKALYTDLDKAGVRVVDLTKDLRSDRFDRRGGSFPRAGTVWSPRAAAAAARAIYKSVKRTDAAKAIVRDKTIVSKEIGVATDGEVFAADSVGRIEGDLVLAAAPGKEGAPVVVIGDAHAAAYGQAGRFAGIGNQLSLAFGAPVETRSDATLGWQEAAGKFSPKKDNATKIVVWCFSGAAFLAPPPAAATKSAAKPVRRVPVRPGSRSPRDGGTLKLRDDPGLDVRAQ